MVAKLEAIIDTYKKNEKEWFGTDSSFLTRTSSILAQTPSSNKKRKRDGKAKEEEEDDVLLAYKTPAAKNPQPGGVPF